MYGSALDSRKWVALISFGFMVGLSWLMWWMMGGCETSSPPPAGADNPDMALPVINAMQDDNLRDLTFRIACFWLDNDRLPTAAEVAKASDPKFPDAWPAATAGDRPITYRPTGKLAYDLVLQGPDRKVGTADDIVIPQEIPPDMPRAFTPDGLRAWWDLQYTRVMLERMKASLSALNQ